jgi:NADH:ubiquinone oxidoreductase subunit H
MLLLIVATLLKIGFVIGVLLGIAPLLVWAERRQSAMIQDRVGPVRAGFPLPPWWALSAGATAAAFGAYATNVAVTVLFASRVLPTHLDWEPVSEVWLAQSGEQVSLSLIPLVGGLFQVYAGGGEAWVGPLVTSLAQIGAAGVAIFALVTKVSTADFIRGPASLGAKIVAYLSIGGAATAALLLFLTFGASAAVHGTFESMQEAARPTTRVPPTIEARRAEWESSLSLLETAAQPNPELASQLVPLREAANASPTAVPDVDADAMFALWDTQFSILKALFGWAITIFLLLAGMHFIASWVVKGLVDKRGHFTAYGFIHPAVDAVKAIWKEDFTPPKADKFLYSIAPIIATIPAFATFAVVPFGPDLLWGPEEGHWYDNLIAVIPEGAAVAAREVPLQVANINVGILFVFAIAGTGIVGAAIAGYSSDNKYALLGGLRAASQMVSYEVTLGLTLVGCFMVYGTLLLDDMVAWQQHHVWGFIIQPLALILFFFCAIAEMKRVPFDAPEGESEIVAGYFLEYAGMKFVMFMMGEFIEHIVSSAIIVTIFFGGYDIPFLHADGFHFDFIGFGIPLPHIVVVLLGVAAFLVKVLLCCFLQLQVRWTLPRFRYDQIMALCWKLILPLSLANILITGVVILLLE